MGLNTEMKKISHPTLHVFTPLACISAPCRQTGECLLSHQRTEANSLNLDRALQDAASDQGLLCIITGFS